MRVRRWLARLGLVTLGLAGAGLAGEALVRMLAPQPVRPAWSDEVGGVRVARASVRGRHAHAGAFDVTVTINRQRLRGRREYAAVAPPGVTRVAVLGDSMAFGWGAEDDETYPARLEGLLARRRAVEVVNAGFPGTCLGEKLGWYETGVRPLRPRVVLLTLLGDDVDGDLYWQVFQLRDGQLVRSPRPGPEAARARTAAAALARVPGAGFLAERSQLFMVLRRGLTRALSRERTTALGQRPATAEERRRFHEEGLPLLRAELRRLQAGLRGDGAALGIVFVPFRQEVYRGAADSGWWAEELRWKSRAIVEASARTAGEMGVPFLDLAPALARRAAGGPPLYHSGAETHPTPAGYAAIAEEVAAWVEGTELLSEPSLL